MLESPTEFPAPGSAAIVVETGQRGRIVQACADGTVLVTGKGLQRRVDRTDLIPDRRAPLIEIVGRRRG